MWEIITGVVSSLIICSISYYYYFRNNNDNVSELFSIEYNNIKCIKYNYRGRKYLYLTDIMTDTIETIQNEIDPANTDKDKKQELDYKHIKLTIKLNTSKEETSKEETTKEETTKEETSKEETSKEETTKEETTKEETSKEEISKEETSKEESDKYQIYEILLDEPNFMTAFAGPANTYYFAFDTKFNEKLTIFMTYLFETEAGALTYGRVSDLLNPEQYFKLKSKLINFKNTGDYTLEWKFI